MGYLSCFKNVLVIFSLSLSSVSFASFSKDYQDLLKQPRINALTATEVSQAQEYHFVFVAGILNELYRPEYFLREVEALNKQEIAATRIYPSSKNPVAKNTDWLKDQLETAFINGGRRPMIVVGHSKGGAELVSTLISYPELVSEGKIAKAVAFESVLGGTELIANLPLMPMITKYSPFAILRSINPLRASEYLNEKVTKLKRYRPKEYAVVNGALSYLVASRETEEMQYMMQKTGKVIGGDDKIPNDGAVATKDMMLQGIGQVMGYISADHLELVLPFEPNVRRAIPPEKRQTAFTYALVRNLLKVIHGEEAEERMTLTRTLQQRFFEEASSCQRAML